MNRTMLEHTHALVLRLLLLQLLWGCAAAQDVPSGTVDTGGADAHGALGDGGRGSGGRIYVAGGIAQWENQRDL